MIRIAVRFKNKILMPMKVKRASKFLQNKEARIRYDCKIKLHYLELLREPSGYAVIALAMFFAKAKNYKK